MNKKEVAKWESNEMKMLSTIRAENAQLRQALQDVAFSVGGMRKTAIENEILDSIAPHPLYVAAPEMLELAKLILIAEAESHGGDYTSGICDSKDNDGKYYQSAFLCEALSKLAALVDKIEVNPTPAIDDF